MIKRLMPLIIALLTICIPVHATEYPEPQLIRCTCYTAPEGAITHSGQTVREGIVAGDVDCEGYVAILYDVNMEYIGMFEVLDTGGDPVKNGYVLDVYRYSLERCHEWINKYGDYVYIQLIPAVG